MSSAKPHRKLVRHFDQQGEIHELTFSCYHRWPLLEDDWRREQLSAGWHWLAAIFLCATGSASALNYQGVNP